MLINEYKPGQFCWEELATTDPGAAKDFYAKLFGWKYNDNPMGPDMVYTMIQQKDADAGGLYKLTAEMEQFNVPPNWLSYVCVKSVDDVVSKVEGLGGQITRPAMDVMDVGRMALLVDPTGAHFALWEPRKHDRVGIANEHGAFTWNELMTSDVDKAGKFYTELFGWKAESNDMGGVMYTVFMRADDDKPAAGMMQITKEMGPVPPHWAVYFGTDDCDQTAKDIAANGGRILVEPQDIPEVGRFAMAMDPQGAAFAVMKLANPPA